MLLAISLDYKSEDKEFVKLYLFLNNELNNKIDTDFNREIKDKHYDGTFTGWKVNKLISKKLFRNPRKERRWKYLFEITKK
jgi:hypothetical protein